MNRALEQAIRDCKARGGLRHAWYPADVTGNPQWGTYIENICDRCGARRRMKTNERGAKLTGWTYVPPFGVTKDEYKAITVGELDDWRLDYISRLRKDGKRRAS